MTSTALYRIARAIKALSRGAEQLAGWLHGLADRRAINPLRNRSLREIRP